MRQQTLAEIRHRLIRGQWPPNTVLQEQPLADELQVSKTPVREALQTLSVQNLLKPEPRVGYRVSDLALEDLAEVFELRILLESEIVGAATSRGSAPTAGENESALAAWEQETSFHEKLARLGGGSRMQRTVAELLQESARGMHYYHLPDRVLVEVLHDHDALVQAICARDVILARSLMTIHLTRIRESLMASLRQTLRDKNLLA
jgi:DNA-binding GntR family transcriptional regulator